MMQHQVLIIDDEPDIRELLEITLKRMGLYCHCAEDLMSARKILNQEEIDLCLTDMKLPDGDGVEFVSELQKTQPNIPIAVITAHGSMDSAIQALKYGAFDFLSKPIDLNSLRTIINGALKLNTTETKSSPTIIGNSGLILDLRKTIEKVARSQAPIYISGESGTGKELVAKMIHDSGPRTDKPFVPINCGAIPGDLMESEFFGHMKGSFTGAISDKDGLFKVADGGTLFLDEVAELPQHMQVKLLRAIQEKVIRPVGSQSEINVDVRILSATHHNLAKKVEDGQFRQDLFYRINVIEVNLPPLRDRIEDIEILSQYILEKLTKKSNQNDIKLSREAIDCLKKYFFPGNVRELENILERAMTLCDGKEIELEDISIETRGTGNPDKHTQETPEYIGLENYLVKIEKEMIIDALEKTKWNKTAAAKLLGISFRALRYRLSKLNID